MRIPRSGVVVLATALTLLTPVAAEADNYNGSDASGDVVFYAGDSDTGVAQPTRTEGDIVATTTSLNKRRATVSIRYRELTAAGTGTVHIVKFVSKKRVRQVAVVASPGHWNGQVAVVTAKGDEVRCKGVRRAIYYSANLVKISIPARCLSRPSWVRTGIGVAAYDSTGSYLDDGQRSTVASQLTLGPRVNR